MVDNKTVIVGRKGGRIGEMKNLGGMLGEVAKIRAGQGHQRIN